MTCAFSVLVILRIAGAGASFLLIVLLGRLLGADGLGAFSFAMSWLVIAQLVTTLGLHHYAVRAVPPMIVAQDHGGLRGLIRVSLIICLALSVGLLLLAPSIAAFVQVSPQPDLQNALLAAMILIVPLTLNQLRSGLLRGFGKPVAGMTPELVLYPCAQLFVITLLWLAGREVSVGAAIMVAFGAAISALLAGMWPLVSCLRSLPAAPPRFRVGKWLVEGGKSTVLFAVAALMGATDVLMLGLLSSAAEIGVYTIAARFFLLMQIPALAASGAVSHLVAEFVASEKFAELSDLAGKVATRTTWFALATAVLATAPALAAGLIFGPEFAGATTSILIMTWVRVAEAIFGHPASFLANGGRIGVASMIAGGGVALNIGLNFLLIPAYGALGAAIATSAAHLLTTFAMAWVAWRLFQLKCLPSFVQRRKEAA